MDISAMNERRKELHLTYAQVSAMTGVPIGTVQKVLGGITKSPRMDTVVALEKLLGDHYYDPDDPEYKKLSFPSYLNRAVAEAESAESGDYSASFEGESLDEKDTRKESDEYLSSGTYVVKESRAAYKVNGKSSDWHGPGDDRGSFPSKESSVREAGGYSAEDLSQRRHQGEYTLADYLLLPDDHRVELIDGVFYDMSAPSDTHQIITGQIYHQLWNYVDGEGGSCFPMISPADVQLDDVRADADPHTIRTIVEPDVYVTCNLKYLGHKRYYGAPDFVVEVLSPSTKSKDMNIKLGKYQRAGVKEYWLVDPEKEKVIVHVFGETPDVAIYGFDAEVPVTISGGKCRIDFKDIRKKVILGNRILHGIEPETE